MRIQTEITSIGTESYLDLGGIIARLEGEDRDLVLPVGFKNPHSFRGYYEQLAFKPTRNISVGDVLDAARSAVGRTFEGWKGGHFEMSESTDCWIAEEGCSSDNQIGPLLLDSLIAAARYQAIVTEAAYYVGVQECQDGECEHLDDPETDEPCPVLEECYATAGDVLRAQAFEEALDEIAGLLDSTPEQGLRDHIRSAIQRGKDVAAEQAATYSRPNPAGGAA